MTAVAQELTDLNYTVMREYKDVHLNSLMGRHHHTAAEPALVKSRPELAQDIAMSIG